MIDIFCLNGLQKEIGLYSTSKIDARTIKKECKQATHVLFWCS